MAAEIVLRECEESRPTVLALHFLMLRVCVCLKERKIQPLWVCVCVLVLLPGRYSPPHG